VAFPRLNSLGFWIQPCGYLLIAKIGFLQTMCWKNYDKVTNNFKMRSATHFWKTFTYDEVLRQYSPYINDNTKQSTAGLLIRQPGINKAEVLKNFFTHEFWGGVFHHDNVMAWKLYLWKYIHIIPDSFAFLVTNAKKN